MALKLLNRTRDPDQAEMSFIDHLEALRWHIVRSLIAVLIGAILIFINKTYQVDGAGITITGKLIEPDALKSA